MTFKMESSMAQLLRVSNANLVVYIHPSNANKIQQALCRQLSVTLFTFNETFDGILLAYSLDLQNKTAKILQGLIPYLCVNVKAKLLLFSPKQDMLLEGKVVKLSKESIYVIVLGFCAVIITLEDIRGEFKYKIKDGLGVFSSIYHKHHVIKPGTMLRFSVKRHGGAEDLEVDWSIKKHSKRVTEVKMEEQDHELLNEGDPSLTPRPQKKVCWRH